ncbi:MAG TPA: toll/interleukin-1 receptor domain-containing protein [Pyrinomonadaceae bacterium]|jgi:hypothetical protein
MKLFISWSGVRSKAVAEALRGWIPDVIHAVQPWMSSEDIDPGARWSAEIDKGLDATKFGIICVTPENIDTPWILFEAGALAKAIADTSVCPYLVGLDYTSLRGPLAQFQAAQARRDDTYALVRTINQCLGEDALSEDRLRRSFERWWPDLEAVLENLPEPASDASPISLLASPLGLEGVYQTRGAALENFAGSLNAEIDKAQQGKPARIWIVSSSCRGFLTAAIERFDGQGMIDQIANTPCDFRILMTDPDMADFRAEQEGRAQGAIQTEIRAGIAMLKYAGIKRENLKYYPGTPTVFAISTADKMLLNPYPYERESQRCFSLIVRKTNSPEDIYHQYIDSHFEKPWKRAKEIPPSDWGE